MADLTSYIKGLLKEGYDINSIKRVLLNYGYPEQMVDQAIYNLNRPEIKHTLHITKTVLIAVIIIVSGLIITSFLMFRGEKAPKELLDVSIESVDEPVKPGDFLEASIELSNMGSAQRYDIYMKYEIFSQATDERLTFLTETVALETTKSHNLKIKIPEDAPEGAYSLQITARHEAQAPRSVAVFRITGGGQQLAPSCSDGIKNQGEEDIDCGGPCPACKACSASCDDLNPSTRDYCDPVTKECKHEATTVCGDSICSGTENENTCPKDCKEEEEESPGGIVYDVWTELDRINLIAQSDPGKAVQECNKLEPAWKDKCLESVGGIAADPSICDRIQTDLPRDRCFSNVAKVLDKTALCENINKDTRRDSCYMNFAVDGDYSYCDKITNEYLKKSCNTLKLTGQ